MPDSRKVIEGVIDDLCRQGWTYRRGKHIILYPVDKSKRPVTISLSPTDGRWYLTMITKLRRAGANL